MERSDWHAMILHYLGVDHIGHMSGPDAPHMIKKQRQMDDVVRMVFEAIQTRKHQSNTLLILLGDHGMLHHYIRTRHCNCLHPGLTNLRYE